MRGGLALIVAAMVLVFAPGPRLPEVAQQVHGVAQKLLAARLPTTPPPTAKPPAPPRPAAPPSTDKPKLDKQGRPIPLPVEPIVAPPVATPWLVRDGVSPLAVLVLLPAALLEARSPVLGLALLHALSLAFGLTGLVLLCVWLDRLLRESRVAPRRAGTIALVATLASPLVYYGRAGDGTTWAAAGLVLALSGVARATAGRFVVGVALLALGRPELLGVALLLWLRGVGEVRLRRVVPLVSSLGSIALAAWWRAPVESTPWAEGLFGLLFSTGKSLIVYAPWLLCAAFAWRRMQRAEEPLATDVLAIGVVGIALVAMRGDWHGDPGWGPRAAVVLLPVLALPLGWAAPSRVLPVLVAAAVLIAIPGLLIAPSDWLALVGDVRVATGGAGWFGEQASDVHFVPQLSPVLGHAWLLWHRAIGTVHLPSGPWALIYQTLPSGAALNFDGRWATIGFSWWAAAQSRGVAWAGVFAGAVLAALGHLLVRWRSHRNGNDSLDDS